MQDLTVTLIQTDLIWEDIDANLEMFDRHIDAVEQPGELIILPEMFSTGFSMAPDRLAESMEGKAVTWLKKKAAAKGAVITGSLMIDDNGRYYNRLVWARPDGNVLTYDKKHLFRYAGEEKIYAAGSRLVTIELNGWRIRPFICYDLRFPIWCRNLDRTYDLSIFVANWPAKRSPHWRALLRARAIENQSWVIGVNRVGTDGNGHAYQGHSAVIDPLGKVLFEEEEKHWRPTIRLSHETLQAYRSRFPAWMDGDSDMLST